MVQVIAVRPWSYHFWPWDLADLPKTRKGFSSIQHFTVFDLRKLPLLNYTNLLRLVGIRIRICIELLLIFPNTETTARYNHSHTRTPIIL